MSLQALPTFISQLPVFFDLFFLLHVPPLFFFFFELCSRNSQKSVLKFQDITCSKFSSLQSLKPVYKELWNQVTPLTAPDVLNEINVKVSDEFVAHSKYSINIYLNHL